MNSNEQQELERLFGSHPCIKATLEQTCGFGYKNSDTTKAQPIFRDRESLLGHVVQRAKSLGTWIERIEDYAGKMIGNGQENDVFISKDNLYAIKLNNFALLSPSATSLDGFIHRLMAHNELFPDDAYIIIGFTHNSIGEPCVVLKQPFMRRLTIFSNHMVTPLIWTTSGLMVNMKFLMSSPPMSLLTLMAISTSLMPWSTMSTTRWMR